MTHMACCQKRNFPAPLTQRQSTSTYGPTCVVGSRYQESTWYAGSADFIQHGQLALLKQAFPLFFRRLPVGLYLDCTDRRLPLTKQRQKMRLLVPRPANEGGNWNGVRKRKFGHNHWICSVVFTALTCEDAMFAHPMTNPDDPDETLRVSKNYIVTFEA